MRQEKKNDRNKEKINQESRQLNVEVSEQIFIKLKTRAVEERVALRKLVEEALLYYLNRK
jgi:predicted HicB family RNase H-like nuclease